MAALTMLHARPASADRTHVVILAPAMDHPAVARLRGELAAIGVDVDVIAHADPTAALDEVARRLGAVAALRVETGPPAAVLWVDPAVSTPNVVPSTRFDGSDASDPALLALRTVELLRARLLQLPKLTRVAPASPDPVDPPRPPLPPIARSTLPVPPAVSPAAFSTATAPVKDGVAPTGSSSRRVLGFSAAPAMLVSPGGVSPSFGVRLGAEWDPFERVGLEATGFIPASSGSVTTAEGSASVRMLAFGGGVHARLTPPEWAFSTSIAGGVDAAMISYAGDASAPLMAMHGSAWGVAPYLTATAGYRVHPMVSLRLDVAALLVRPEPSVMFSGQSVASFATPAVIPSLGVEVRP